MIRCCINEGSVAHFGISIVSYRFRLSLRGSPAPLLAEDYPLALARVVFFLYFVWTNIL